MRVQDSCDRHIVGAMAFWQRQVDDLLAAINTLAPPNTSPPDSPPAGPKTNIGLASGLPHATRDGVHNDGGVINHGQGSSATADAVASLRHSLAAIDEAEREFRRRLNNAHTADAATRARLRQIHQEVNAGVTALQPSIATAAGQEQMANFLEAKAHQARDAIVDAQSNATRLASVLNSAGQQFAAAQQPS